MIKWTYGVGQVEQGKVYYDGNSNNNKRCLPVLVLDIKCN